MRVSQIYVIHLARYSCTETVWWNCSHKLNIILLTVTENCITACNNSDGIPRNTIGSTSTARQPTTLCAFRLQQLEMREMRWMTKIIHQTANSLRKMAPRAWICTVVGGTPLRSIVANVVSLVMPAASASSGGRLWISLKWPEWWSS